jgi:hypothetical protein
MVESAGRWRLAVAVLIVLGLIGASVLVWRRASRPAEPGRTRVAVRDIPGQGERVVVEVLNASGAVGLARSATRRLRDAGLDVVYFGSDTSNTLDSTQVLVRRGDDGKAERVRRALGLGSVRAAPDSTRLVDVTIRLGRDFAQVVRDP